MPLFSGWNCVATTLLRARTLGKVKAVRRLREREVGVGGGGVEAVDEVEVAPARNPGRDGVFADPLDLVPAHVRDLEVVEAEVADLARQEAKALLPASLL